MGKVFITSPTTARRDVEEEERDGTLTSDVNARNHAELLCNGLYDFISLFFFRLPCSVHEAKLCNKTFHRALTLHTKRRGENVSWKIFETAKRSNLSAAEEHARVRSTGVKYLLS